MNRQFVIDNDIVARYIRKELNDEELTAFEVFYLNDEETLDELEVMSAVEGHLGTGSAPQPTEKIDSDREISEDKAAYSVDVINPAKPKKWFWPVSTAAALLVGIGFGSALSPSRSTGPEPALPGATIVNIEMLRGSEDLVVEVPKVSGSVVLRVAVGTAESAYQVSLTRADGERLTSEVLSADAYGEVVIVMTSKIAADGPYELVAIGADSGESVLSATVQFGFE